MNLGKDSVTLVVPNYKPFAQKSYEQIGFVLNSLRPENEVCRTLPTRTGRMEGQPRLENEKKMSVAELGAAPARNFPFDEDKMVEKLVVFQRPFAGRMKSKNLVGF